MQISNVERETWKASISRSHLKKVKTFAFFVHASGLLPSPLTPPPPTTAASTTSSCSSPCCERNFAVRRGEGEEEVQTFLSFSGIGWKGRRRRKKNFHIPRTRAPLHEKRAENSMNTFSFPSPSLPPFSLDFSEKRGSLLSYLRIFSSPDGRG